MLAVLTSLALVALGIGVGATAAAASPTFTISGHIVGASSIGVDGATVTLLTDTTVDATTTTSGGGVYSFTALAADDYTVDVDAPNYLEQSADANVVASDVTVDMTLVPAGLISGTVRSGGSPVAGVFVDAYDSSTSREYDAPNPTDAAGAYSIKVPLNTPLEVETDGAPPYGYQAYNGHNDCGCTFDPVTVAAGVPRTGIDFDLIKNPVEILTITILDDPTDPGPPDNSTVHLYRQVSGGYEPVESEPIEPSGESVFEIDGGADMHFRVSKTDPSTHVTKWYSIEAYAIFDGAAIGSDPLATYGESGEPLVCTVPLSTLQPGDERLVLIALSADTSLCGAEPAVIVPPAPVVHHHRSPGLTTTAVAPTPTPTPTPTAMPTETPSASPSPTPSASSTPAPLPASSNGGLPWWVWLLIILAVIVILGALGFVLLRRR